MSSEKSDGTVYILLPVHNRLEITRRFVECLSAQTADNYHLLLIDDGSTDGTSEMVSSHIRQLTILRGDGECWWAGSLQKGYDWLKSKHLKSEDIVLIINDDTEFDADFLEKGISVLSGLSRPLLLARSFSKKTGRLLNAGVHADWGKMTFTPASSDNEINCMPTRGLFMKASDFLALDGFHPRILPHYASDYEFTIRAIRKGMKPLTDPELNLRMDEAATGYHNIEAASLRDFLSRYFSIKSPSNPFFMASFVLLACPWKYKPINICRIVMNTAVATGGMMFHSISGWVRDRFTKAL